MATRHTAWHALLAVVILGHAPVAWSAEVTVAARIVAGASGGPGGGAAVEAVERLALGQLATLEIRVEAPADAQVFVPSNPALGPFKRVGDPPPVERRAVGARQVQIHRVPLLPVRLGAEAIPPIEVPYRLTDGRSGTESTPRLRVRVDRLLPNEQDPALGPAPAPVPVIAKNWALIWLITIVAVGLVTALITLILIYAFKQRLESLRPKPPPRPANEVALERLGLLERADVEPVRRLAETSDVLREYLGARYGFDGLESTTAELFMALAEADLKTVLPEQIRTLLDDADLVKFARFATADSESQAVIGKVRGIVEETWEPPDPDLLEQEVPRHEPASAPERMKAAAIDIGLLGGMTLLLLAGFWAFELIDWGWISVVVFGLLLLLRDASPLGSPGKAMMGLEVVRRDEAQTPPSQLERVQRNALLLLAPIGLPVEALVLVYHPLRHLVGDLWAGTEVVRVTPPDDEPSPAADAGGTP